MMSRERGKGLYFTFLSYLLFSWKQNTQSTDKLESNPGIKLENFIVSFWIVPFQIEYCRMGMKIADLLEDSKASNTFSTVENGELKNTIRSTADLKDFGYLLIQVEEREIAEIVLEDCKSI